MQPKFSPQPEVSPSWGGGLVCVFCELPELSVPSSPGFSRCQGFGDLTL